MEPRIPEVKLVGDHRGAEGPVAAGPRGPAQPGVSEGRGRTARSRTLYRDPALASSHCCCLRSCHFPFLDCSIVPPFPSFPPSPVSVRLVHGGQRGCSDRRLWSHPWLSERCHRCSQTLIHFPRSITYITFRLQLASYSPASQDTLFAAASPTHCDKAPPHSPSPPHSPAPDIATPPSSHALPAAALTAESP